MSDDRKSGFIRNTITVILELAFGPRAARYAGVVTIVLAILLVILIVGGIGAGFQSCRKNRAEKRDAEHKEEILKDKGKIEIIGENRNAQLQNNNHAAERSEKANADFGDVLRTDTDKRDGNFSSVRRKFCADHPNDSKCR